MIANPIVLILVVLSVVVTIFVAYYSRRWMTSTAEFYVAGRKISWMQNGIALVGDYLSAASFLGVAGAIALAGIDRIWIGIGFFGGYMAVLMMIAGPLRNVGTYTVADALYKRFKWAPIKIAVMLSTIVISVFYLVPQILGAGILFELVLGWDFKVVTIAAGVLMGAYIVLGGMRATTYNQIIQGILLWGVMVFVVVLVLFVVFDGSFVKLFDIMSMTVPPDVAAKAGEKVKAATQLESLAAIQSVRGALPEAPSAMSPGILTPTVIAQLSTVLALVFGTAGLPHILIRFYTVPTAADAKKSVAVVLMAIGLFYIAAIFMGFMSMYLLYPQLLDWILAKKVGLATNMPVLLTSKLMGGDFLMGIAAAGAVAAMLSTAAGLLIATSSSITRDLYASFINKNASEKDEIRIARITTATMSVIAIMIALVLRGENVAWLVTLAFGMAASALFPALACTLWWKRFTRQAAVAGIVTGLTVASLFIILHLSGVKSFLGLTVVGSPGIYSITASFLAILIVTTFTKDSGDVDNFFALAHAEEK